MKKKAFTLIELLIVVAIIAILAAIAVPNFLEAQIRSKVSRARADMRTVATALESYSVDWNGYPQSNPYSYAFAVPSQYPGDEAFGPTLENLTTPRAYLSSESALQDPFVATSRYSSSNFPEGPPSPITPNPADLHVAELYHYMARDEGGTSVRGEEYKAKWWILESCGPDRAYHNLGGILWAYDAPDGSEDLGIYDTQYDPTNGTVSQGSIFRVGGGPSEMGDLFYQACMGN